MPSGVGGTTEAAMGALASRLNSAVIAEVCWAGIGPPVGKVSGTESKPWRTPAASVG
ncbi:hypothetical protein D3C86_1849860 [compost metagenome]